MKVIYRLLLCSLLLYFPFCNATVIDKLDLFLPFANGDGYLCTQGPGGSVSHSGPTTKYDLDFFMLELTPLIASLPGKAYRFDDKNCNTSIEPFSCSTYDGFGWHIKLDISPNQTNPDLKYYVLYGHLSGFNIPDNPNGTVVSGGVVIGYSGGKHGHIGRGRVSGPTGQHLHFGLHQGDPSKAKVTASVPHYVYAGFTESALVAGLINTKEVPCNFQYVYSVHPESYTDYYDDISCSYFGGSNEPLRCILPWNHDGFGGGSFPDFAFLDVSLEDALTGKDIVDTVRPNQQLKVRCRHFNDGADSPEDIEVKALLSNGENVDNNPTTVGTDNIQKSNLDHNEKHSKTIVFNAPNSNGIYNVTCDTDTDNDVMEEHESNNEYDDGYVFEVDDLAWMIPIQQLILNQ